MPSPMNMNTYLGAAVSSAMPGTQASSMVSARSRVRSFFMMIFLAFILGYDEKDTVRM